MANSHSTASQGGLFMSDKESGRFWAKVNKTHGCWLWDGCKLPTGYGRLHLRNLDAYAHRVSYQDHIGPIPKGFTIDHLCQNPPCVRPDHLEAVTQQVNILRAPNGIAAANSRKTHCKHGHEFSNENTYRPPRRPNQRLCRACLRNRRR